MPHILLTNDDGYQAGGLRALAAALEGFATVSIVAPSREQSGTAQSLTLWQPIVCNKIAARVARAAAEMILKEGLQDQVLLNVNVPEPWTGKVKFTRQSQKITRNQLSEGKDPRGRSYFWLFEQRIDKDVEPDTDYAAIFSG